MTLPVFIALALFPGLIHSSNIQLLNTKNAQAYASSVAEGTSPAYAIDEETSDDDPTCFLSSPGHFDADGFAWLVVDLGIVTSNITEIYLVAGSHSADARGLEVFVTTHMRSVAHYGEGSRLPWDSYAFCGHSTSEGNTATVQCTSPLHGRWLLLRQYRHPLQICLLAVYVIKSENQCFKLVHSVADAHPRGSEFRMERHTSLEQCRDSCAETLSCQGLAFTSLSRRRSTGVCRLFRGLLHANLGVDLEEHDGAQPIDCGVGCQLETNQCNRGLILPLTRMKEKEEEEEDGAASVWKIEEPEILRRRPDLRKVIFGLEFKGRITCKAESCGDVNVILVDDQGKMEFCASINTDLVSLLDHYALQCRGPDAMAAFDAVEVKLLPAAATSPSLQFHVDSGYARFVVVEKNQTQTLSTRPVPPQQVFVISTQPPASPSPKANDVDVSGKPFLAESANSTPSELASFSSADENSSTTPVPGESGVEISTDPTPSSAGQTVPPTTASTRVDSVPSADGAPLRQTASLSTLKSNPQAGSTNATLKSGAVQSRMTGRVQSDVGSSSQGRVNVSIERKTSWTTSSEAYPLTAGVGALSTANMVLIAVIASVVILSAIAAAIWFACTRGH